MTTTNKTTTIKFITSINLKKMNSEKLVKLYKRIFGDDGINDILLTSIRLEISAEITDIYTIYKASIGDNKVVSLDMQDYCDKLIGKINRLTRLNESTYVPNYVPFVTYSARQTMILKIGVYMETLKPDYDKAQAEYNAVYNFHKGLQNFAYDYFRQMKTVSVAAVSGWNFEWVKRLIDTNTDGKKNGLKNKAIAAIVSTEKHPVTAKDIANIRSGYVSDTMVKRAAKKSVKSIEPAEEIVVEKVPEGFFGGLGLTDLDGNVIGF